MSETYSATTELWLWTTDKAVAAWYFLTIDGAVAESIRGAVLLDRLERTGSTRQIGWGAVKVRAIIGETAWKTSLFPAKDVGGYMLPVKAAVRKAESIVVGEDVKITLELV